MKDIFTNNGDRLIAYGTSFKVTETGKKKILYSMNCFVFNPKKEFVGTDVAKDAIRKIKHCSKQKIKDEYTSIYATAIKIGRGKNLHIEFNMTPKNAANTIFIVPKKWLKEARKDVIEIEILDKDTIKNMSKFIN